jgi:hypothetical protein
VRVSESKRERQRVKERNGESEEEGKGEMEEERMEKGKKVLNTLITDLSIEIIINPTTFSLNQIMAINEEILRSIF